MSKELDNFNKLLDKYKIVSPIPGDEQLFMLNARKDALVSTLKTLGQYSAFSNIIIAVNISLLNAGIRIGVAKTRLLLLYLSVIIICAIASVTYFIFSNPPPGGIPKITVEADDTIKTIDTIKGDKSTALTGVRMGVLRLTPNRVDEKEAIQISGKIYKMLRERRGQEKIIFQDQGNIDINRLKKRVNRLLSGSISKLGNKNIITLRVVNVSNSVTLFSDSISYTKDSELDEKLGTLLELVNENTKIWVEK